MKGFSKKGGFFIRGLQKLSHWFYRRVSGKMLLLTGAVFLLFLLVVLPWEAHRFQQMTGSSVSPDTSFFYSTTQLYQMAEDYGPMGRAYYVHSRFGFDIVWPLVYLSFLVSSISFFFASGEIKYPWSLVNLLPLGGFGFDLLENGAASLVMIYYPQSIPIIPSLAPIFTFWKWICIFVSGAALLLGGVLFFVKKGRTSFQ